MVSMLMMAECDASSFRFMVIALVICLTHFSLVVYEWSTALDDSVGYEWRRHSIAAVGGHYELVYFVYD